MASELDRLAAAAERAASPDHPMLVPGSVLHPPGLIAVPSGELARWTQFWMSFVVLERPKGSGLANVSGTYIQASRNELVTAMLANPAAQWLLMIDDDHTFDRRLLINLLDRHVDVVGAAAMSRKPPYYVCAYAPGSDHAMPVTEFDGTFMPVDAVGTGGILIRRHVFEALDPPWFEVGYDDNGRNISEDVTFCHRARAAGFDVYLDGTQILGHLTGVELAPDPRGIAISFDDEQGIIIPRDMIEVTVEEKVG